MKFLYKYLICFDFFLTFPLNMSATPSSSSSSDPNPRRRKRARSSSSSGGDDETPISVLRTRMLIEAVRTGQHGLAYYLIVHESKAGGLDWTPVTDLDSPPDSIYYAALLAARSGDVPMLAIVLGEMERCRGRSNDYKRCVDWLETIGEETVHQTLEATGAKNGFIITSTYLDVVKSEEEEETIDEEMIEIYTAFGFKYMEAHQYGCDYKKWYDGEQKYKSVRGSSVRCDQKIASFRTLEEAKEISERWQHVQIVKHSVDNYKPVQVTLVGSMDRDEIGSDSDSDCACPWF